MHLSIGDVLNAYTLLGGLATAGLFLFYGAVFVALKTSGAIRDDALPVRRLAVASGDRTGWRASGFGRSWRTARTGPGWCWRSRCVAQLAAVLLVWRRASDGWAFVCTALVVAAVVVLLFGSLYPESGALDAEPGMERDDLQRLVDPLHPEDHDVGDGDHGPAGGGLPGAGRIGCSGNGSRLTGYPRPIGLARRAS